MSRFLEYFRPAVLAARETDAPRIPGPWIERTPSGRILLHRTNDRRP